MGEFSFCLWPISKFDKPFPNFRKPIENGHFSNDSTGKFQPDNSQLCFYCVPNNCRNVCFNLRSGYENLISKDETKLGYLNNLLEWVMLNHKKFVVVHDDVRKPQIFDESSQSATKITSLHTDFICWRGLLTKLLCTPYEKRDDWIIAVCLFNGSYYLYEFETEQKKEEKYSMSARQTEMCYWGLKFEKYLTSDKRDGRPNTRQPVNNHEQFCSVVRTRLNSHSLVFGGEVDAVDPSSGQYVEMKTTRKIDTERQRENFLRYKLIKWWAQSFLIGIPKIICGYRNDAGVVQTIEEMDVLKLPDMVKQELMNPWRSSICFNFLDQFLKFIKDNVTVDDPRVVYLCRRSSCENIITCSRQEPDSPYVILPQWFTQWDIWKR